MSINVAINDTNLHVRDINCLRHMLGVNENRHKNQWGLRNHFAATPEGDDYDSMQRLETHGYVVQGRSRYGMVFYHATRAGCVLVGLNQRQIENALGE